MFRLNNDACSALRWATPPLTEGKMSPPLHSDHYRWDDLLSCTSCSSFCRLWPIWAGLLLVLPRESSHAKSCYHIQKHYPHQSAFRLAWQQATDDMPLWTKHDTRAEFSCQTLMPPACFCWLCWDCLTMSCCSTWGVFSTLQTGLCWLPLAWNTFDEPVYFCLCEDTCAITTADWGRFLFCFVF